MLVGGFTWQDYVFGSMDPAMVSSVTVVPNTAYDYPWWVMIEAQNRRHGGRDVNYIPRTPAAAPLASLSGTTLCNLTRFDAEKGEGSVAIIQKMGIIPARSWFNSGFLSRPQRGDKLETGAETLFVEDVDCVERLAPDGVVRDLKYRLFLAGAAHRRT